MCYFAVFQGTQTTTPLNLCVSQHLCMNSSVQSDWQPAGRSNPPSSHINKKRMDNGQLPLATFAVSLQLVLRLVTKPCRTYAHSESIIFWSSSSLKKKKKTKTRGGGVNENDSTFAGRKAELLRMNNVI